MVKEAGCYRTKTCKNILKFFSFLFFWITQYWKIVHVNHNRGQNLPIKHQANFLADNFIFFIENKSWHFMWIIS